MESSTKYPWPNALRLALALGIVWGGAMFVTGAVATYTTTYAHEMVKVFASIYWWFGSSWPGAFWGLLWGFVDAFVGTLVVVAVYNILGGRRRTA
ncbi:MAG: hypothetical protein ABFD92_03040 [Planctomycetaceae bacterium]|nr:hypothetical protein [Planctomycetaceae bacterium]